MSPRASPQHDAGVGGGSSSSSSLPSLIVEIYTLFFARKQKRRACRHRQPFFHSLSLASTERSLFPLRRSAPNRRALCARRSAGLWRTRGARGGRARAWCWRLRAAARSRWPTSATHRLSEHPSQAGGHRAEQQLLDSLALRPSTDGLHRTDSCAKSSSRSSHALAVRGRNSISSSGPARQQLVHSTAPPKFFGKISRSIDKFASPFCFEWSTV